MQAGPKPLARRAARHPLWRLAPLLLCIGCASPVPAPVLLTLPAAAPAAAGASPPPAAAPRLVLRRVGIPEYLASRRVRYRSDDSTLAEWPGTFWAERLEIGVTRRTAAALRAALPGWTLCEETCGDGAAPALVLQIEYAELDYRRATRAIGARGRAVLTRSGDTSAERPFAIERSTASEGAAAQAGAMAQVLDDVAAALAPEIERLRPAGPR